jgi:hypothetical protein
VRSTAGKDHILMLRIGSRRLAGKVHFALLAGKDHIVGRHPIERSFELVNEARIDRVPPRRPPLTSERRDRCGRRTGRHTGVACGPGSGCRRHALLGLCLFPDCGAAYHRIRAHQHDGPDQQARWFVSGDACGADQAACAASTYLPRLNITCHILRFLGRAPVRGQDAF